ncbi:hypothetical protein QQF64_030441 [Cirrhinus molitorella]|uniref:Uncharacterized protein n=1 Tax=Cirrhinus molitorella TaxID=172907 RepID=A0ABR3N3A5_9TELE
MDGLLCLSLFSALDYLQRWHKTTNGRGDHTVQSRRIMMESNDSKGLLITDKGLSGMSAVSDMLRSS